MIPALHAPPQSSRERPATRLLIADDHGIMRQGLHSFFDAMPGFAVVGEAVDGEEALDRLAHGGIDLLLLDLSMPGISGEALVALVRARHPDLPILVLSMHNEPQIAQRALRAGATGYITKDRDFTTLLEAVRRVAEGQRFIDPELAEFIAFDFGSAERPLPHHRLTAREFEVLRLLAAGLGINEIADALSISNKTISTHKARLMIKMGFNTNADIVRYALANGLIA